MKKNIIIYFPSKAQEEGKTYSYERSRERHNDFISYFPTEKVQFFLMRDISCHQGENFFIPKYKRVENDWIENTDTIYGDLILGPHRDITWSNIFINPIASFCKDKTQIESLFPRYTFQSQYCENYEDIIRKFNLIPSKIKVLKPIFGSKGDGILFSEIIPKKEDITGKYPYIIQEFFDTSLGFEGYEGIHDFRTILINGKISGSFLRLAPPGIFTANVDKGAKIIDFGEHRIPSEVQKIIFDIDTTLGNIFPERYYSIDIGKGVDGNYKIFELNANPMLSTPSIRQHLAQYIIEKYIAD